MPDLFGAALGVAIAIGAIVYVLGAILFWKFADWLDRQGLITFDGFAYLPEWVGVSLLLFMVVVWPIGLTIVLVPAGVTLLLALIDKVPHHLFTHIIAKHPAGEGSELCKLYGCRTCCCKGHIWGEGMLSL